MRLLIVDGYNVIRQTPPYRELAEGDLDAARAALVSDVAAFAARRVPDATVVFDGHSNPASDGAAASGRGRHGDLLPVRHRRRRGDRVAGSRCARAGRRDRRRDLGRRRRSGRSSAGRSSRMSSAEFAGELRAQDAEMDESTRQRAARQAGSRTAVDADTRERLSRWARGSGISGSELRVSLLQSAARRAFDNPRVASVDLSVT